MCSTLDFSGFMKSKFMILLLLLNLSSLFSFSFDDVQFWAGQGSSQAILVIDWQDDYPALVWGYRFSYMTSGADMLNAIAEADERLSFNGSSFVNDLSYIVEGVNQHSGMHGDPNYWSLHQATVEGDSLDWSHLAGLNFTIQAGQALGCSYGIDNPTNDYNNLEIVQVPYEIPEEPTMADIDYWVGSGSNEAALVIDWFDGLNPRSLVWGYRWDGEANGLDMINAIAEADIRLSGDFDAMVSQVQYDLDNNGLIDESDHNMGMNEYPSGYWSYFLKAESTQDWTYASTGVAGRILTDGCWDGWVFVTDWSISEFPYPALPAEAPITNESPISFEEINYWIGQGNQAALLIIDWNDDSNNPSLAWGYRFNSGDSASGASILEAISAVDNRLDVEMTSMLDEITYSIDGQVEHTSIDGGDWWSTWTWTEDSAWEMNSGISANILDGQIFACSYGFTPQASAPDNPIAVDEYILQGDSPLAVDDNYYIRNDIMYQLHILNNDSDDIEINPTSIIIVNDASYGNLTVTTDGHIEYMSEVAYEGQDSFSYQIYDYDNMVSNEAVVNLHIYAAFTGNADSENTLAISNESAEIKAWASGIELVRGPQNISDENSPLASYGSEENALGFAEGSSTEVVSLGDGGSATLTFTNPIIDGPGPDFAVFENAFLDTSLELAFVEVSSNGIDFVRFPAISLTQNEVQLGNSDGIDCRSIHNLAGKYRLGYGTPFDLAQLAEFPELNLNNIMYVRIIDVVGSITPEYASYDSNGNIINDPFPTDFESAGFDLDGIAVINEWEEVSNDNNIIGSLVTTLGDAYPNPFNPETTITFSIPESQNCILQIYNLKGQLVKNIVNNHLTKGSHAYTWNGKDNKGKAVSSGVYLYELKTTNRSFVKKMILQK